MGARAKIGAKSSETKRSNMVSHTRKTESSQSKNSPINHILHFQRTIGNQAVQRLFKSGVIQAKLKIGQPGDKYEREADRVADIVMKMPEPQVRREEEEELVQIKRMPGHSSEVTTEISFKIGALQRSGGQPLPKSVQDFSESRFGIDWDSVRVHSNLQAPPKAFAINAREYTLGRDIVFRRESYIPRNTESGKLLAHEFVHAVQQIPNLRKSPDATADKRSMSQKTLPYGMIKPALVQNRVVDIVQCQTKPAKFPELPKFIQALEQNVGKNLYDYGHHFFRISTLHPDEPELLEDALSRYALGLNILESSYMFAGFDRTTAKGLAIGTGILFKGLTLIKDNELFLDYQINLGNGLKLETGINLGVNPDDVTDVNKVEFTLGLVGRF